MSALNLLNIYALDYAVESTFGVAPADPPGPIRPGQSAGTHSQLPSGGPA